MEIDFEKHASQLYEIFWEAIELFACERMHLLTGSMPQSFFSHKLHNYTKAVYEKFKALPICVGFIDGPVIGISHPDEFKKQKVV